MQSCLINSLHNCIFLSKCVNCQLTVTIVASQNVGQNISIRFRFDGDIGKCIVVGVITRAP